MSTSDGFELAVLCDHDKYTEPMVWIGIYIAVASLLCTLAMTADLFLGFRSKKDWYPCKYFSLNAASITVITIAMKLPVDLSGEMPRHIDQAAKQGSLAFMCTMMANFMPSLAAMDNKTLLANMVGLSILVITIIVNILIEIHTGVIKPDTVQILWIHDFTIDFVMVAYIYTTVITLLLVISIASSLTIPTSKEILEVKYQIKNRTFLTDQHLQHTQMSIVDKLRQDVRRYWVMAESGSPQFVMASNPLSIASGVICVILNFLNLLMVQSFPFREHQCESVYRRSIPFILMTQVIGVGVGTIAPVARCYSVLNFKFFTKWKRNHLMVFIVEKYWTQLLCEWKQRPIHFLSSSRLRTMLYNSKGVILSLCIRLQKIIVILCKVISLILTVFPILVFSYVYIRVSLQASFFTPPIVSRTDDIDKDLSNYVLHIHDDMEATARTLKRISNSRNSFILKAEKEQNKDLLELLEKSAGFKGVETFDSNYVQPLLSVELVNSWSLPIVTLTCIAVALPNISKDTTKNLLSSVGEGLSCTHQVEESLNHGKEYASI
ncbi:hypothetical protein HanXRQr2_Chr10g0450941 [Helianthus annuus]|uniref:Uncharacterized protein n=1 Tax=Helianthus annuus TaxID=4232 RepID=A0A251TM81_HELAN|nr:hypothetical protein HanXRQr2_Chr10g0450941 [Helianthus annuus]